MGGCFEAVGYFEWKNFCENIWKGERAVAGMGVVESLEKRKRVWELEMWAAFLSRRMITEYTNTFWYDEMYCFSMLRKGV